MAAVPLACVTTGEIDSRLQSWIGADADEVAGFWGAPNGTYEKKDGNKILTYERMGIYTTGPRHYTQTYSRQCRIDFVEDRSGKIISATWRGAADQCDRSIIGRGGQEDD